MRSAVIILFVAVGCNDVDPTAPIANELGGAPHCGPMEARLEGFAGAQRFDVDLPVVGNFYDTDFSRYGSILGDSDYHLVLRPYQDERLPLLGAVSLSDGTWYCASDGTIEYDVHETRCVLRSIRAGDASCAAGTAVAGEIRGCVSAIP